MRALGEPIDRHTIDLMIESVDTVRFQKNGDDRDAQCGVHTLVCLDCMAHAMQSADCASVCVCLLGPCLEGQIGLH
jgi:hypothetical protein